MNNQYNQDVYFGTNELKLSLHAALMQRKNDGIHPCMMNFLSDWIISGAIGYYNGDHIITNLPGSHTINEWLPLTNFGYNHFCESFQDLNVYEKSLLGAYFMEQELNSLKIKLVDKWAPSVQ